MIKKFSIVIMYIVFLLSFLACNKYDTYQNDKEESGTNEIISATPSTEKKLDNDSSAVPEETSKPTDETKSVFKTDNINRITFYAYYGAGKGSDVPAEYLDDIITWLDSFKVDSNREFPDLTPPGTNTICVEIEYSDGSIIKQGMDTTEINDVTYYISGDPAPKCYDEIISKTSLN